MGAAFAVIAMAGQGADTWASLLRVGSDNPALRRMETELGPISTFDSRGHDGQLYYLIARDPFAGGDTVATLSTFDTNPPRYRYRRILFPLLAGGFGHFGGRITLFTMTFLVALGMGLATVAAADIAFNMQLPGGAVFLAATNVGALVSVVILTADVLGMGLALSGLALAVRRRFGWAISAFALAGLTKEVYLLVPLSIAAWQWQERRRTIAFLMAVIPFAPVLLWSVWVWSFVPAIPKTTPIVGWPLLGLLNSVSHWLEQYGDSPVQLGTAIYVTISFCTATAMLVVGRSHVLRLVAMPWVALAACSTGISVWDVPTNAARSFEIVWPVAVLMLTHRVSSPASDRSDRLA